jgi:glyoxylase-like metal-dependent hydrolase (beta-lactamase superfamily II)
MIVVDSKSLLVVDRRKFLAAAAGLITAGLLPKSVLALAAPHSFKHGAFDVTVVSDGHLVLPTGVFGPDAPPEALKAILAAAGATGNEIQVPANVTLIKSGADLILFDNGSGSEFQPSAGKLVENLKLAGVDPATITKVVFTHAHPDHIWATVNSGGGLNFPNASYYCAAAEWDFWMGKDILTQMPTEMHPFVLGAQKHLSGTKDRVTMVKPGDDIVTGIRVLETHGHTPGHVSFEVAGDDGLIIVGDAIGLPVMYFPHPDWKLAFDAMHDVAIANRKKLLDRAATEKTKMLGFHWPYPGVGYAERKDNAYQYVPAT